MLLGFETVAEGNAGLADSDVAQDGWSSPLEQTARNPNGVWSGKNVGAEFKKAAVQLEFPYVQCFIALESSMGTIRR